MKILLTGSSGMVGRNILEHSSSQNHCMLSPNSLELNLLDAESVQNYISRNEPDMIIHAAGIVGGIMANMNQPVKFLVDNMQMGLNIVMSAKSFNIKKFMNLGSSCMYPKNAENPLSEDLILKGDFEPSNEGYALAKVAITRLCDYICREDQSFQYKTVIPCNLYGKYDNFDPEHSHMIPGVIRKINDAKKQKSKFIDIWGDGLAKREFMYAADFADFVYYSIDNFKEMPQNINVGLGIDFTINEYYQKIANVIGFQGGFTNDLSRPTGMRQKLIDNAKLQLYGWKPQTTLEQGIQNTYDYFISEAK